MPTLTPEQAAAMGDDELNAAVARAIGWNTADTTRGLLYRSMLVDGRWENASYHPPRFMEYASLQRKMEEKLADMPDTFSLQITIASIDAPPPFDMDTQRCYSVMRETRDPTKTLPSKYPPDTRGRALALAMAAAGLLEIEETPDTELHS